MYFVEVRKEWVYLCDDCFKLTGISKYSLDRVKDINQK